MNSSFGTTVARHRRPHFGHCLASGPLADQLCTSKFGEREILTAIYWGLLKQPDNQKLTRIRRERPRHKDVSDTAADENVESTLNPRERKSLCQLLKMLWS